ncbi:peptidase C15, pyroglutamyl peptidase I-like protein [Dendrothele bispora CBS 962.96]|uniref:Peptidase C15, pyroglutamyl peptidase I-like protein n=1 Tax=Dendrothele bispora (strain CBS 962.96) TaxID=1314807 RepID=A0A4S8ML66_DENBC|nr:peptidase C15, pyroglutamyl peptidase I-like protein [Dendrothele bispora CBS 962.96]
MTAIKHRVLVTGYGPFRQYKENPSWFAVRTLHNTVIHTSTSTSSNPEPIHITSLEVPVVYSAVLDIVPGLHAAPPILPSSVPDDFPTPPQGGYTLIVHVGVAGPTELRVEMFGDKTGYDKPDHEGKLADIVGEEDGQPVRGFNEERYGMFPERLQIQVPVDPLLEGCANDGTTLVTSIDAGQYLCDFIFYCSLAESKMAGRNTPVLFIHCPPIGEPLSTEQVTEGLKSIVANVCARLK